jgi:hypothetical protein
MDDPMIRSRLGRIKGTRPLRAPDPKRGPSSFLRLFFFPTRQAILFNDATDARSAAL